MGFYVSNRFVDSHWCAKKATSLTKAHATYKNYFVPEIPIVRVAAEGIVQRMRFFKDPHALNYPWTGGHEIDHFFFS